MRLTSLPPIVPQVIGVLLAVFVPVFWALTGRLEPLFLGFSVTLLSIGVVSSAGKKLKESHTEDKDPE